MTKPSSGYIEVSDDKECDEEREEQDDDNLPEGLQTQYIVYEDVINSGDGEEEYLAQSLSQSQQLQTQNELEQDAILNMDFDLAPPEGGWDNAMSPTPTPRARRHQAPTSLDTQAILSVETQPLDLSLPEPEGGFTQSRSPSAAPPSSPPLPAESNSTSFSIREIRSLERERQQRSAAPLPPATYSQEETEEIEEEADPDPPLDGPSISAFTATRLRATGRAASRS